MWQVRNYDDAMVKDICYNCGSKTAKQSYNYFRRMDYVTGGKVWSKVWSKENTPIAFYYASRSRDHIRLVEIAVREDYQMQGYGRFVVNDLLARMKKEGIHRLTFRTPVNEDAQGFWLHLGAKIVGAKGNDYEMELTIE